MIGAGCVDADKRGLPFTGVKRWSWWESRKILEWSELRVQGLRTISDFGVAYHHAMCGEPVTRTEGDDKTSASVAGDEVYSSPTHSVPQESGHVLGFKGSPH